MSQIFQPLDIVQTPSGAIAIVIECYNDSNGNQNIALQYLAHYKHTEKCAWWSNYKYPSTDVVLDDLVLLDSIPRLLSNSIAHNMGSRTKQGNVFFPLDRTSKNK